MLDEAELRYESELYFLEIPQDLTLVFALEAHRALTASNQAT
jgi:hypothetical protein